VSAFEPVSADVDELAASIVDAAFKVHSALGPGLLESVYQACLMHELAQRRIVVQSQVAIPIVYRGLRLDAGLRLDLLVAQAVIVEIKAIEEILPVHHAQLLTYLKLSGKRLGLLINFNVVKIKDGIKRVIL
jgi:GxxExxY protein